MRSAALLTEDVSVEKKKNVGGKTLRENGAHDVIAVATHAVFSGPAVERLSTGVFSEVIVSNTIDLEPEKRFSQLTVLSIAPLIGETLWRLNEQVMN